jgi:hypothetical protein
MVTRHSKQIPMPHKEERGCPVIEVRKAVSPANKTATATVVPAGTTNGRPFTLTSISSLMDFAPKSWLRERDPGR